MHQGYWGVEKTLEVFGRFSRFKLPIHFTEVTLVSGWLKSPAGLVRKDISSKPVYDELLKLIKGEWWTAPLTLRTDGEGKASFRGFLGEYELTSEGKKCMFRLEGRCDEKIEIGL